MRNKYAKTQIKLFKLLLSWFFSLYFNHRGLNRFHRGHAAYIPYILTYIGRVTSMKAIQAPVILIIKRIIQLAQAMIKITFSYYL